MPSANVGHYFLGTQGLALLRGWMSGGPELARRVDEIHRMSGAPGELPMSLTIDIREHGVADGYARWSETYDAAPNPLIRVEQPVVRAMIDRVPAGAALDAACGTGRHTAYLVERGHRAIGVDATPEMLARARERVPGAEFREGTLERLPVETATIDLAVCSLALTHVPDPTRAIAEIARVLGPGGRFVLSDFHPMMLLLGGGGFFVATDGTAGNVRSYAHLPSRYLAAFRAAGLEVVDCVEPAIEEQDLAALSGGMESLAAEAFRGAWIGMPNAIVWELVRRA
ncbi:MAG TPA: class I SAM-dependent methyltransferase [Candidatus Binatia bacterium]|nr:class I SAM-dependent methyltransferase [Candidatus Binatia bacterium]